MEPIQSYVSRTEVTPAMTALAMGSGDLGVLATPAMIALMENAAMIAASPLLEEGLTTVGASIECTHLRPTLPGRLIEAEAILTKTDGKKLYFEIEAREGASIIGRARHLRVIVDKKRFMEI